LRKINNKVLIILSILAIILLFGCQKYNSPEENQKILEGKMKQTTKNTIATSTTQTSLVSGSNPIVVFETTLGNFEVELNSAKAPITVKNFLDYVNSGYYDGLIFHRVINDFMVQGGGFDKDLNQKNANAPIKNEANNGLKNDKYTIAMARTPVINSATAQFFVNVKNNDFLNYKDDSVNGYGYAVFGKVITGTDTIDKMKVVQTHSVDGYDDVPIVPIIINKAYLKK
jgi:peptidyl-prolyl cis-trans isomerase B (cyclophilin B)